MDSYTDSTLGVYTDARTEYSKQLCQTIVPAIFKVFMELLKKAREDVGGESRKVLFRYQTLLNEIPDWNMDKVYREINGLVAAINCEYLKELITAVFLAHTKVLMAIRISKSDSNINLTVPAVDHFLFKVLCETGKLYWKSTYLFRDDVGNLDKQQNLRAAEQLVVEGVHAAIRAMIPVKNILKDCIQVDKKKDDSDDEDEAAPAPAPAAAPVEVEPAYAPAVEDANSEEIAIHDTDDALSLVSVEDAVKATNTAINEGVGTGEGSGLDDERDGAVDSNGQSEPVENGTNVLHIDEEPEVKFAEFDSVFDGEDSNMHYDPKTGELMDGELIIEDGPGEELTDFDMLGEDGEAETALDDYEELIS